MSALIQQLSMPRPKGAFPWSTARKNSEVLLDDVPLMPAEVLDVTSPQEREVVEAPMPRSGLLSILPKWLRVTRLWFEGRLPPSGWILLW